MQNKLKKRTRDPEAKKRAIIEASLREFAKHGFAGARADKIALVAGVSVGTVFHLFTDKKGLANAVFTDCLQVIHSRLAPALTSARPAREAFDQMWAVYVEMLFREPDRLVFFEYQPTSDFLDPNNRAALHVLRQGLLNWIKQHQPSGVLIDASTELLRAIAIGSLMRMLRESIDGNTTPTLSSLNELRNLVWNSIAQPSAAGGKTTKARKARARRS